MVGMVTEALRQIKADRATLLDAQTILALCREVGYQWRARLLDPVTTIHLFILQILHSNTACSHLPHLTAQRFTASAFCQDRTRLPLVVNPRRPDRVEPRAVTRRPKPYPLLTKPRRVARNALIQQSIGAELNAIRVRSQFLCPPPAPTECRRRISHWNTHTASPRLRFGAARSRGSHGCEARRWTVGPWSGGAGQVETFLHLSVGDR